MASYRTLAAAQAIHDALVATEAELQPLGGAAVTDQATLPGFCWRCCGRGLVTVAATAITPDGDRYCIEELVPCPDCRPAQDPPNAGSRVAQDGRSGPPA